MITREISNETVIDNEICEAMTIMDRTKRTLGWAKTRAEKSDRSIYNEELLEARIEYEAAAADYLATAANYMGWKRFWLVTNTGGHIHSSLDCSTTRPTTSWAWLTELAGRTEAEAVEEYGAILCTVCFASAPVEHTGGTNKKEAARKAFEKAIREINRTVEGKKVKNLTEKLNSARYNLGSAEGDLRRIGETAEYAVANGHEAPDETVRIALAATRVAKGAKSVAAYEKKLAAATIVLEAALNGEAR
jgi:hypothetical protein